METRELHPNQIITLNDYPLHSESVLGEYLSKCRLGEQLPLVPVVKKDVVRSHFNGSLREEFERFEKGHPGAEYFMLDGSHRTTALTLAGCTIRVLVYENDNDIHGAQQLVATGHVLENGTLEHTLEENCEILNRHFVGKPHFMTVEEKTRKMVTEGILPSNVVD